MTVDEALWEAATKDAGLDVGHVWTEMRCPAYDSLNPDHCTCQGA